MRGQFIGNNLRPYVAVFSLTTTCLSLPPALVECAFFCSSLLSRLLVQGQNVKRGFVNAHSANFRAAWRQSHGISMQRRRALLKVMGKQTHEIPEARD